MVFMKLGLIIAMLHEFPFDCEIQTATDLSWLIIRG